MIDKEVFYAGRGFEQKVTEETGGNRKLNLAGAALCDLKIEHEKARQ
jgi:hypothetical protein